MDHQELSFLAIPALVLAILVVVAVAGRVPWLRSLVRLALTGVLLWIGLRALADRARFDPVLGRYAALVLPDRQQVTGGEVRVPLGPDGHFWVRAEVNGHPVRLLVDSGATVTALSQRTAEAAGLRVEDAAMPVVLRTANGAVPARTATVGELRFGPVVARGLLAVVSPAFGGMDVLGMNFLSRLKGWRVEDGVLILVPHHPQAVAADPAPAGWRGALGALWPDGGDARGQ